MSDREAPIRRILDLVCRPGVYEALTAMRDQGGASFGDLVTHCRHNLLAHLRALVVEGFVVGPRYGTWDVEPSSDARFELTGAGHTLLGHLDAFQEWAQMFPRPTQSRFSWRRNHSA